MTLEGPLAVSDGRSGDRVPPSPHGALAAEGIVLSALHLCTNTVLASWRFRTLPPRASVPEVRAAAVTAEVNGVLAKAPAMPVAQTTCALD